MQRNQLTIVGAGPAGLSAAIEAAEHGLAPVVCDENARPGGQLFKQIHKFFGSREHKARERGFRIGQQLLDRALELGVVVQLSAVVLGIYENLVCNVMLEGRVQTSSTDALIIATGASENMIPFPGWTLPGVIGAGAAQTLANMHGIRPGERLLMVGCGNVGVVVAYQMLQAGCQVAAMIDAAPAIGGYGVHAAKVARTGVPFHLRHTIREAFGQERVEGATIVEVDEQWQPVPGSEKTLDVDTICLAVGLNPATELCRMAGCLMTHIPAMGGFVPAHGPDCSTSIPGVYVAGDVSGIEEASAAMIEGRIAGLSAARHLGCVEDKVFEQRLAELRRSLSSLRHGPFGERAAMAEALMQDALADHAACAASAVRAHKEASCPTH